MTKHEQTASDYFRTLVESFIAHPADLKVTAMEGEDWVTVRPSCNSRDFGRIIGGGGTLYPLLSMLMELAGDKAGKKFVLQRLANVHGPRELKKPTPPNKNWSAMDTLKVEHKLRDMLNGILIHKIDIFCGGDSVATVLCVKIDDNEPLPIQHEDLIFALSRIIGAVGATLGREIKVESA